MYDFLGDTNIQTLVIYIFNFVIIIEVFFTLLTLYFCNLLYVGF